MPTLSLVTHANQIANSHLRFVRDAPESRDLALKIMRRTEYWVYDPTEKSFSPSKFSGYADMDFRTYGLAKGTGVGGDRFDGGLTQQAISSLLGDYQADPVLANELVAWADDRLGPGSLKGIDQAKWRFTRLSPHATGGLASLAGGWEGSEELVESIMSFTRTNRSRIIDLD